MEIRSTAGLFALVLIVYCSSLAAREEQVPDVQPQYTAEIAAIRLNRSVQAAMEYIVAIEPQSRRGLIELTEIPAPPFGEEKRAQRFAEMLREAGLSDVTIDEVGNVIGRRPGKVGERVIAYSAHLDTVFPPGTDVTVRFDDEKMYAPGIGDNTRGLVTVLGVLRALQKTGIETNADILFIGNVGEEGLGDLRGVKYLFRERAPGIDTLIAVDGGESSRIVFGGVGSHRYRVTFRGPGGHSWGAFGLASPHHALGRAISIFVENAPSVTSVGEKTSYNVGRIGGGTSINSIAFESWTEIDMRSGNQDKLDDIDAVLQAAIEQALQQENAARLDGPELTVDVERVGARRRPVGDRAESACCNNVVRHRTAAPHLVHRRQPANFERYPGGHHESRRCQREFTRTRRVVAKQGWPYRHLDRLDHIARGSRFGKLGFLA